MARMPYTNFHDINLDWIIKRVMKAFTPDNPPDYPVKSVNSKTGNVVLDSDDIQDIDSGLDMTDALRKKQNRPESTGTAGQVLGLDNDLQPVWLNQPAPGVSDYDDLTGRPKINNVTLSGEMNGADLGLLDAPAAAGSQGQVLTSDGQGGQTWQTLPTPPQPLAGDYAPVIMDSASGPVASFPDGAAGLDMASLVAEIVPTQLGSGDPSPNNIRPITGRGGVTVYHNATEILEAWGDVAGTVYRGTIDIVSGVLTVDWYGVVDMSTLNWSVTGDRFTVATMLTPNPYRQASWNVANPMAMCDRYIYGNIGSGSGTDKAIGFYNGILYARDTTYTNATDFKNSLVGSQLVYKLDAAITYQLTPQQVQTVLGQNDISSDSGDCSVTYRADTKLFILKVIS